ncbi:hypothetical protein AB4Z19_17795 [Pseudoduganella sp. RAF19]
MAIYIGTDQNDTLFGTSEDDSIYGGAGDDSLVGTAGNDLLDGGTGNDTLVAPVSGNFTVNGGDGDDTVLLNMLADGYGGTITGGVGRQTYVFESVLYQSHPIITDFKAGASGDCIDTTKLLKALNNYYYFGGNPFDPKIGVMDLQQVGADVHVLFDRDGISPYYNPQVLVVLQNVELASLTRDNFVNSVPINTGAPGLLLTGTDGNDSLVGDSTNDTLLGNGGNDTLSGDYGHDLLNGGDGDDVLIGGDGDNTMYGGDGNDTLIGTSEDKLLDGGAGNDAFSYKFGDLLVGNTTLSGGAGDDSFTLHGVLPVWSTHVETVFIDGGDGNDRINMYFNWGENDNIKVIARGGAGSDTYAVVWDFNNGFSYKILDFQGGAGGDMLDLKPLLDYVHASPDVRLDPFGIGRLTFVQQGADTAVAWGGNGWPFHVVVTLANFQASTLTDANFAASAPVVDGNTITGSVGADSLQGTDANNYMQSGAGADTLDGGAGADTLIGGSGNDYYVLDSIDDVVVEKSNGGIDTVVMNGAVYIDAYTLAPNVENAKILSEAGVVNGNELANQIELHVSGAAYGMAGNDTMVGDAGAQTLSGGDGDDVLIGGGGHDVIDGGAGKDELRLEGSYEDYRFALSADGQIVITRIDVDDVVSVKNIESLAFSNVTQSAAQIRAMLGTSGDNVLTGTDRADVLDGLAGNDTMIGGKGDDAYYVDSVGDKVVELAGGGQDTVYTTLARYTMSDNVENLIATGSTGFIGVGNNLDNLMHGTSGADRLEGLGGNDRFEASAGNDTYLGGDGEDTVLMMAARSDYTVKRLSATDTLITNTVTGGTLTVRGVEYFLMNGVKASLADLLVGLPSTGADSLVGGDGADTMDGMGGNDTMVGGGGDDLYLVSSAGVRIIEKTDGGYDKAEVSYVGTPYQLGDNVEEAYAVKGTLAVGIAGNAQDNLLKGNDGVNVLQGAAGNDTLDGGAGGDRMMGGTGDDTYYVDSSSDVVTEFANEGHDKVITKLAIYALAANVDDLSYEGSAAFRLSGNVLDNVIQVIGGASGVIDGGAGADTVLIDGVFSDYVCARPNATDLVLSKGSQVITLRNVEAVSFHNPADDSLVTKSYAELINNIVSVGNDILVGTSGNDRLDGGKGNDSMAGGSGDDTYVVDAVGDVIHEDLDAGTDKVEVAFTSIGTYILSDNIENAVVTGSAGAGVTGNASDNNLKGNSGANTLVGNAGNDTLDGGAGADRLIGGVGDDTYVVDSASDVVTELLNEGHDTVKTALATYTLAANVEELIFGGASGFKLTGNTLDNTIYLNRASGTVDGAAGNDTVIVDGSFADFVRTRPNATDLVLTKGSQVITLRNVEAVSFHNTTDDSIVTKSYKDLVFNVVSIGNDILGGTAGDDRLDGGKGADDMTGGAGNDTYVVDVAGDVIHEDAAGGTDMVEVAFATAGTYTLSDNLENAIIKGSVAANVIGNGEDNILTGNGGANSLSGMDGDDTLDGGAGNDVLNGGAGNDSLIGGAGNDKLVGSAGDDTYVVDSAADVIVEQSGEGTDTVLASSSSYTLSANVEALLYTGSGNFTGTGNADSNLITGGAGNDVLNGMGGDDTLLGGAGSDTLTGGAGTDYFVLNTTIGSDTVKDFVSGTDKLIVLQSGIAIGNKDNVVDGAEIRGAAGGFSASAELVVFTQNVASMNAVNAAAAIGSAASNYHAGDTVLFALHSGTTNTLFKFTSNGDDAVVSAAELTQLATLTGAPIISAEDLLFA